MKKDEVKKLETKQVESGLLIQHCIDAYCIGGFKYIKNGNTLIELVDENEVKFPCN